MSKFTLDEAIKHCLEEAGELQKRADSAELIDILDGLDVEACKECAAQHRQLAEWLKELKDLRKINDKIYDVLAKQFGSPCNLGYAVDEYMRRNGSCDDCGVEIPDKECWSRYIQTKLTGDKSDGI